MWAKLTQIFTKPRLIFLGKVAVFVVGAGFTFHLPLGFFYGAGGIFGLVVLIWYAQTWRHLISWRCVAFFVASLLIGVAVLGTIILPLNNMSLSRFAELGPVEFFGLGVFVGTIMLPVAHKLLLGASWKRVSIAIPCIYGIWIIFVSLTNRYTWLNVLLTSYEGIQFEHINKLSTIINQASIWQAAYLISMFGFRKKESEAMESSI